MVDSLFAQLLVFSDPNDAPLVIQEMETIPSCLCALSRQNYTSTQADEAICYLANSLPAI